MPVREKQGQTGFSNRRKAGQSPSFARDHVLFLRVRPMPRT